MNNRSLTVDIGVPLVVSIVPDIVPNEEPMSSNCMVKY